MLTYMDEINKYEAMLPVRVAMLFAMKAAATTLFRWR